MYKKGIYTILSNEPLTPLVYRMVLEGDTQYITRSGQFINIELDGKYLRRPISVSDYDDNTITIIYKVVGSGTEQMRGLGRGTKLDILTGLGNGFSTDNDAQRPLLVGGGVGVLSDCYGAIGCAIAISGALVIGSGLIMNIYYHRIQHINILTFWQEIAKMSWWPILITLATHLILQRYVSLDSWLSLSLSIAIYTLLYVAGLPLFMMNSHERQTAASVAKRIITIVTRGRV